MWSKLGFILYNCDTHIIAILHYAIEVDALETTSKTLKSVVDEDA